jgi:hypothetical protein
VWLCSNDNATAAKLHDNATAAKLHDNAAAAKLHDNAAAAYISGDLSPICKRHLESMLKGIKSYLCLVQTGHVDVEGILFGTWKGIRALG